MRRFLAPVTPIGWVVLATGAAALAAGRGRGWVEAGTAGLLPRITTVAVGEMAEMAAGVHVDAAILDYVAALIEGTRTDPQSAVGVSVRGGIALVRCAKVWAASRRRGFVVPDDVKELAQPVLAHRIVLETEAEFAGVTTQSVLSRVVAQTPPPVVRVG